MSGERRKEARSKLGVATRVQGQDKDGTQWVEMTSCEDASYNGARFRLLHKVERGQVVQLWLPMPKLFRHYDFNEPTYRVYSLVRALQPLTPGSLVSVFFLGRNAPRDYEKTPGMRYLLPSDPKPTVKSDKTDKTDKTDRRLLERLEIFINLRLTRVEGSQQEFTVAENLSKGGARVPTSLPVARGEVVTIEEVGGPAGVPPFKTRAEIRNVKVGRDNVPRLHLKFLDGETPDRLFHIG